MKMQRIIVKVPVELLGQCDEPAYRSRLTREELIVGLIRRGLSQNAWISGETAAERSGHNLGHIRRLCAEQYEPRGLACKVRQGKARSSWLILESANPAFTGVRPSVEEDDDAAIQRSALAGRTQVPSNPAPGKRRRSPSPGRAS